MKNHMPDDGLLADFIPHIATAAELPRKLLVEKSDAALLAGTILKQRTARERRRAITGRSDRTDCHDCTPKWRAGYQCNVSKHSSSGWPMRDMTA